MSVAHAGHGPGLPRRRLVRRRAGAARFAECTFTGVDFSVHHLRGRLRPVHLPRLPVSARRPTRPRRSWRATCAAEVLRRHPRRLQLSHGVLRVRHAADDGPGRAVAGRDDPGTNLAGSTSGVDLREADLSLSDLTATSLRNTRLDPATLRETRLGKADLRGASLDGRPRGRPARSGFDARARCSRSGTAPRSTSARDPPPVGAWTPSPSSTRPRPRSSPWSRFGRPSSATNPSMARHLSAWSVVCSSKVRRKTQCRSVRAHPHRRREAARAAGSLKSPPRAPRPTRTVATRSAPSRIGQHRRSRGRSRPRRGGRPTRSATSATATACAAPRRRPRPAALLARKWWLDRRSPAGS